jgi:hypothetical protein
MAEYTSFAGLYRLEPGDPVSLNNYEFYENEVILDQYVQAFVTHRHNGAPAMGGFASAATLTPSASGGQLDPETTYYIGITALDAYGGETAAVIASAQTAGTVINPTVAPVLAAASGGTLNLGTYRYAYTIFDGYGETTVSPQANISLPSNGKANITLPVTSYQKRVYRAFGYGEFNKVADVAASSTLLVDDGSLCLNCDQSPPEENTAGATNRITVTRPALPASAAYWRVYVGEDADLTSPAALYAYSSAGVRDIPSAASAIDFTSDTQVRLGTPPEVSRTIPGAALIYAVDVLYDGNSPAVASGTVESALDYISNLVQNNNIRASNVAASAALTGIVIVASAASGIVVTQVGSAASGSFIFQGERTAYGSAAAPNWPEARDYFTAPSGSGIVSFMSNTAGNDWSFGYRAARFNVIGFGASAMPTYQGVKDLIVRALPGINVTASAGAPGDAIDMVIDRRRRHRTVWSASGTLTGSANYINLFVDDFVVASATAVSSGEVRVFLPPTASANLYPGIEFTVKSLTSPAGGSAVVLHPNDGSLEGVASGRVMQLGESLTVSWDANNSSWWIG